MAFVLDCSVALAWLLPDEDEETADKLADRLDPEAAVVPSIWRLEIGNALLMARKRRRFGDKDLERLLAAVLGLPIEQDTALDDAALSRVIGLARKLALTSYDAAYLELAQRRGLALATLDARLREACPLAGVAVLP